MATANATGTTAATNATAGLRRTAAPRAPPELSSYKTRFNAYLQHIGLPFVDDLTPEDIASPGDIESIMCSWAEYMSTNPPRYMNNQAKLLKADGVGNGFGLIKEYLKDRFGRHVDWADETWFTLSKGALVKKLERDSVRGTSGVDEVPGTIGIVRLNPDAGITDLSLPFLCFFSFLPLFLFFFPAGKFPLRGNLEIFAPEKLEEKFACKFSTSKFSEGCLDRL